MTIKRIVCLFALCCVLLLPLTATAAEIGDVDGDNTITTTDVRLVLAHATRRPYDFSLDLNAADVNGDGTITPTDARILLQYYGGKINSLSAPAESDGGALPGDFFSFSEPTLDAPTNTWSITVYMHASAPLLDGMVYISYPADEVELVGKETAGLNDPYNSLSPLSTVCVNPTWEEGVLAVGFCEHKNTLVGDVEAVTLRFRPKTAEGTVFSLSAWVDHITTMTDEADPTHATRYTGSRQAAVTAERELPAVSLTPPTKTEYGLGTSRLDLTGGGVTYTWRDGTVETESLDRSMISNFDSNRLGKQTLTITWGGYTIPYEIEIVPQSIASIALMPPPDALLYSEETGWTVVGGGLAVSYNNGHTHMLLITADMLAAPENFQPGLQTITLTYEGWTLTFEADVQEPLPGVMGDVDLDGKITSTDARLILQYVVNKITEDDLTVILADVDGDTFLTTTDARLTLQRAVGKEAVLPQPDSLTVTKSDTPPEGEQVSFTAIESVKDPGYAGSSSSHSFYAVENAAQWAYLRNAYGFTAAYDEAFFKDKALLVGNLWMPNLETLFEIKQVAKSGDTLEVFLRSYYETDHVSPMICHTLVAMEIPKSALTGVDTVAVYTQYDPVLPIM